MTSTLELFKVPHTFNTVFDSMLSADAQTPSVGSYPPTDIQEFPEGRYKIILAVAGFSRDELVVERTHDTVTISGEHAAVDPEETDTSNVPTYTHRGISRRKFKREFSVGKYIEVRGANLTDGLLTVDLSATIPDAEQTVQIPIL